MAAGAGDRDDEPVTDGPAAPPSVRRGRSSQLMYRVVHDDDRGLTGTASEPAALTEYVNRGTAFSSRPAVCILNAP